MMTARLMIRSHRWMITSWAVLLIALAGGTISAYQTTYTTAEQRRTVAEQAQSDVASRLLYGDLPQPGTPAMTFTWEIGAFTTILVAILSVLLTVSLTRAAEDDGTVELLRSAGIGPRVPLRSAMTVLAGVAAVLTLGSTLALGLSTGHVDAVTWPGALAYGCVVGTTFLLVAALTLVCAQVAPTTGDARLLGFATVGVAFGLRAVADTRPIGWLNWLSPLALRSTVRPFNGNRWWVLLVALSVALALAALAAALSGRREYGAGLLHRRDHHTSRLAVHSCAGLAARLNRRSIIAWTVAVAGIGALFSTMGSGVVQQSRQGDVGGFLGSQLGVGDPVAGYFAYYGTVVGLVVCTFAVLCVLQARKDEVAGRTDQLLTTGQRRWEPLVGQLVVAVGGSAAVLVVTGLLSAVVAPTTITGTDVSIRAFAYTAGQWPATAVAAGWAGLTVGLWPRLTWLAWAPLLIGGTLALLGELLEIPHKVTDLGIFQHVPDVGRADPDLRGLIVLLIVAGAAGFVAVVGSRRRDVLVR